MADDNYLDSLQVFEGENEKWYYRGRSNNGEILFVSEAYEHEGTAIEEAKKFGEQENVPVAHPTPKLEN